MSLPPDQKVGVDPATTTLREFCLRHGYAPPAMGHGHGGELWLSHIQAMANQVLRPVYGDDDDDGVGDDDDGVGGVGDKADAATTTNDGWKSLDSVDAQVKFGFLVARQQILLLQRHFRHNQHAPPKDWQQQNVSRQVAQAIRDALDSTTETGQRLEAFIRKAGDICISTPSGDDDPYEQFLQTHPEWRNAESSTTISNCGDDRLRLRPLHPYQAGPTVSSLCSNMMTTANMILYRMYRRYNKRGESHDNEDTPRRLTLNISRSMRNRFNNQQVFETIFINQGGHPDEILKTLLGPHNPRPKSVLTSIHLHKVLTVESHYKILKSTIEAFGPLLLTCHAFPALTDRKKE